MKNITDFIQESSTGEFKGKKGLFNNSKEWKQHKADHEEIDELRKIAKETLDHISEYGPGNAGEIWNIVYRMISSKMDRHGHEVRLGNIFGRLGKNEDSLTSLNKPAHKAQWVYCPGWDSCCTVSDMDSIHTYTTGLGWAGSEKELLERGFLMVKSWLQTILAAIIDPVNGYQDYEDGTFFNCKNGAKIREKYGWRAQ